MSYEAERQKFKEAISKYTDNVHFLVHCGNKCEPTLNIAKTIKNEKYAVKIFLDKKYFAVWDLKRHLQFGGSSSLSIADNWNEIKLDDIPFVDVYKSLGKRNNGILEKILLVKFENFKEFFLNYEVYMSFNEFDKNFPNNNATANTEVKTIYNEAIRKRYSTTKAYRDAKFRDEVLAAYDYKCAICRCDIQEVLQAAHECGYDVASTVYDDSRHGICLCANHHLMYDNGLIDIDIINHSININDSKLKETVWFKEFSDTYNSKIIVRNDTEE